MRVSVSLPQLRLVVSRLQQAEAHLVVLFLLPGGSLLVPAWIAVRRYRARRPAVPPKQGDLLGEGARRRRPRWSRSRTASVGSPAPQTLALQQPTPQE